MSSESQKKIKDHLAAMCSRGFKSRLFDHSRVIISGPVHTKAVRANPAKGSPKTGLQVESIQLHKLRPQHSNFTIKGLDLGNIHVAHLPIRTTQDLRELLEHKRLRSIQVKDAKLSIKLEPDKNTNELSINERYWRS